MKKYALIKDGVVTQTQPMEQDGFIEVSANIVCGMHYQNGVFSMPEVEEDIKEKVINAIQNLLDTEAKKKGYDNIISVCSYAGFENPFRTEGEAYGVWRASCWQKAYEILAEVKSGTRETPSIEDVLSEMPTFIL